MVWRWLWSVGFEDALPSVCHAVIEGRDSAGFAHAGKFLQLAFGCRWLERLPDFPPMPRPCFPYFAECVRRERQGVFGFGRWLWLLGRFRLTRRSRVGFRTRSRVRRFRSSIRSSIRTWFRSQRKKLVSTLIASAPSGRNMGIISGRKPVGFVAGRVGNALFTWRNAHPICPRLTSGSRVIVQPSSRNACRTHAGELVHGYAHLVRKIGVVEHRRARVTPHVFGHHHDGKQGKSFRAVPQCKTASREQTDEPIRKERFAIRVCGGHAMPPVMRSRVRTRSRSRRMSAIVAGAWSGRRRRGIMTRRSESNNVPI